MTYEIVTTSLFRCQYKSLRRRGYDLRELERVVTMFQRGERLPAIYRDHGLTGDRKGQRDCHIRPDWLLIYRIEQDVLVLSLLETGTHSDLGF